MQVRVVVDRQVALAPDDERLLRIDVEPLTAELDLLRADLAKLREEQADGEKALKDVVAKRESFVESVEILGKAVDESRRKREEVGSDSEVKKAMDQVKDKLRRAPKVRPVPSHSRTGGTTEPEAITLRW